MLLFSDGVVRATRELHGGQMEQLELAIDAHDAALRATIEHLEYESSACNRSTYERSISSAPCPLSFLWSIRFFVEAFASSIHLS